METEGSNDAEEILDTLVQVGVVGIEDERGGLRFTSDFLTTLEEVESFVTRADEAEIMDELDSVTGDEDVSRTLLDIGTESGRLVMEYLALSQFEGLSHLERLQALTVFDTFYVPPPPTEGSPEMFLPVRGERLPFLFEMNDRAIVYIWREDCPPCEIVKDDLDEIFSRQPEDVGLFSVYGPDCSELLQERYDITGGPTTLFIEDGEIDYRVYSAPPRDLLLEECRRYTDDLDSIAP